MPWVVVFDTNILLSDLLSLRGSPARCVALAKLGTIESVTCLEILVEFQEKLQTKFGYAPEQAEVAVDEVRSFSRLVTITNSLKAVAADPGDDKIIECALVAGASHIVTGDRRHLLPMGTYQGILIIGANDFLALTSAP